MRWSRIDRQLKSVWGIAEDNAKLLELGAAWCRNLGVDNGPRGIALPERMTGIPGLSGGSFRCDYAKEPPTMFGMQLENSALEFYERNCVGCEFRDAPGVEPNLGTWAEEQIAAREEARRDAEEEAQRVAEQRDERDRKRRLLYSDARAETREILDLIKRIDTDPRDEQAAEDLRQIARQHPASFGPALVDAMLNPVG